MKYDVIIQKCDDPVRAAAVADRIAGWVGRSPEMVCAVLLEKSACIRKGADEAVAQKMKSEYEALGATVELCATAVVAGSSAKVNRKAVNDEDDGQDVSGRVLTDKEYVEKVTSRNDIFIFEGNPRLKYMESVALVLAVFTGLYMSAHTIEPVANNDFFEKGSMEKTVVIEKRLVDRPESKPTVVPQPTERKSLRQTVSRGSGGAVGGGGDPRARATKQGLLGILSGKVKGKTVAAADVFGKGGFATDIDAIISGVNGLKSGGGGAAGRRVEQGMGFGTGYGSGLGGSGGIGDLIDNLMASNVPVGELKKRASYSLTFPPVSSGGALIGGRSKAGIMRVVMQNISALRHAYNKRLRDKPGLKGRITVKFAIDEFGKVLFCSMQESTMGDENLEMLVINKIRNWRFDKIDKPGDVTEVVYPFVFSQ